MHTLFPAQASAHAAQLDTLALLVHALMFALAVGWGSVFVYSVIRFRSSRNPKADYNGARGRTSTYSEAAIVIAELILLVGFSPFLRGRPARATSRRNTRRSWFESWRNNSRGTGTLPAPMTHSAGSIRRSPPPTTRWGWTHRPGQGRHHHDQRTRVTGGPPGDRASERERRHPQFRHPGHAREAGCEPRHDEESMDRCRS